MPVLPTAIEAATQSKERKLYDVSRPTTPARRTAAAAATTAAVAGTAAETSTVTTQTTEFVLT